VPKEAKDKAKTQAVVTFFRYALEKGHGQANRLDYVPLPAPLVQQVESYISANLK
jgi:phosphate transport system substrate-binding protein